MDQLEQAAVSFKKALDGSKKKMKKAIANRKVELADVLFQLEKPEEAKAQLENVKVKLLYGDFADKYDQLMNELN